ncbi:non-heme iron oxygenase ferredoxin subunit [Candidatus Microgenomates bacterium]|nr:non-heme iron oxygenase ferredoxin subunit [Candidatus Microgenomates bacterium]
MADFVKITSASQIAEGQIKKFEVNGESVAIANLSGQFFALGDTCTHHQCSLSEGVVMGENIVCPCHGGQFDLKTGKAVAFPAVVDEKIYEVKVENDDIYIKI